MATISIWRINKTTRYKINVQFKERLLNKRYLHAIELPITKRKKMKKWKHWWFIPPDDVPQYIFWTEVSSTFDFRENWFFFLFRHDSHVTWFDLFTFRIKRVLVLRGKNRILNADITYTEIGTLFSKMYNKSIF